MRDNDYPISKTCPPLFLENYGPDNYHGEIDTYLLSIKNSDGYDMDHTEEVVIGSEQGTTFPTKIGTTICNALIDTGATRCCISEKYYKKLQLAKIHLLQIYQCKISYWQ